MPNQANLAALQAVARSLGPLRERVVFVGGATTGLYSTVSTAPESRPTNDVDCIIEVVPRMAYYALEEELRALGFENDQTAKIICRWRVGGLVVDVMPINAGNLLGFSNPWYPEGFAHALAYPLPDQSTILILPAVYFIATKLVALRSRGMSDIRTSTDLEDIVYVLDNRVAFATEVAAAASPAVRSFVAAEFNHLMHHPEIREAIDCHLPYGSGNERQYIIEKRFREVVDAGK